MNYIKRVFLLLGCLLAVGQINAQYFGQNKARYGKFDFKVHTTPHFEIYHYLENDSAITDLSQQSEHWYCLHQAVLKDTFSKKNPIIFYNDHADFQQTNAISGSIGVGTGGVTEGLKNRVIMPLTHSNQQTSHVLGHELVHAFQYHMVINGDSTSLRSLSNIPLWMVEGLAEYLSIGRSDAHTAMWMRDAVHNENVPKLKDLNNPRYFPYRWGQAFWAFVTGVYGDEVIEPLFMATAKNGLKAAVPQVLGISLENLSTLWQDGLKNYYQPFLANKELKTGKELFSKENAGRMNLSPVLSPNGKYVVFLSEKDLFSLDLFLAEARSGKIIRKLASPQRDGHIDDFSYLESAGTWSPNSKQFAYVVVSKGANRLVIKNIENGKTEREIEIPGLPAITNPAWSPDGKTILVSALVQGQNDLYTYNLKTEKVTQITNDNASELQANWSADGTEIVFSTDKLSLENGRIKGRWAYSLATMNIATGKQKNLNVFYGADNFNPVFDHNNDIVFLSNRDGYRNVYRYDRDSAKVYQLTDLLTGVSGITHQAPALTVSPRKDRILYSVFADNRYTIFQSKQADLLNLPVAHNAVEMSAAMLPAVNPEKTDVVNTNLAKLDNLSKLPLDSIQSVKYRPQFKLDYVGGGAGVGVGIGNGNSLNSNTALAGGVEMLFGDILGNNKLFTGLSLNGELSDFSGQVSYLNQKGRIAWGASLSHLVSRSGFNGFPQRDEIQVGKDGQTIPVQRVDLNITRLFQDGGGLFAQLPLSRTNRFEAGADFRRYSFSNQTTSYYYDLAGRFIGTGAREKSDNVPDALNIFNTNAAFVSDNSVFGLTGPLKGHRYRIGVEQYFGDAQFFSTLADFRQYKYLKPVSLAFRGMHYARHGKDANSLPALYAGDPTRVRGYGFNSIGQTLQENEINFNQLTGSKLLVGNFEVRLPFTGPKGLALIKSNFLFSDLSLFLDGGVAFSEYGDLNNPDNGLAPRPIFSTGASLRVNVFGAFILEPYYAIPLQKQTRGVFGVNIVPGW